MEAIVVGAGIGGLATALMLHSRGIGAQIYEQADGLRELGVGINTLPQAIEELSSIGLLHRLDEVAIRTHELFYLNRLGQEVWREKRGMHVGHPVPQFSIHRGRLQGVLRDAVIERLGGQAIHTSSRLAGFSQDEAAVTAWFFDRNDRHVATAQGDILIGADGIHSYVRRQLAPNEGPPKWNGLMLWRGARNWPVFLDGCSMIVAGGLEAKVVVYPIGAGERPDTRLTNWAVIGRIAGPSSTPPLHQDWSRTGDWEDLHPHVAGFRLPGVDAAALMRETTTFWEYPMCDRDPLPHWTSGRVTLLGDAAHPMYPVGSNGASQAILDARALADALVGAEHPRAGLAAYEAERLPATAAIVLANRQGGPEGVIDAVEAVAPDGFDDVDKVLPYVEREAIVRGRAGAAALRPTGNNEPGC
jgi:2-polyprenyl-6-methoxyphenol hydroxylase-like FAD-dependent oxidoreductase